MTLNSAKLRWVRYGLIVCHTLAAFPVLVFAQVEENGSVEAREKAEETLRQKVAFDRLVGYLHLGGKIVDQQGAMVSGVQVGAVVRSRSPQTHQDAIFNTNTTVNGVFDLEITNAISATLTFQKDGYYDSSIAYAIVHAGKLGWGGKKQVVDTNINVVLKKSGDLTTLQTYSTPLEYSVSGTAIIGDLTGKPGICRHKLSDIEDESLLPEKSVYLTADQDNGKILLKTFRSEGRAVVIPSCVKLRMNDKVGGFLEHMTDKKDDLHVFREMKEAPADGYVNHLDLTNAVNKTYFFVKVGDMFGKGYVLPVKNTLKNDTYIRSYLRLFLQPDGSRNLEALNYN